jgi:hypothetical protein
MSASLLIGKALATVFVVGSDLGSSLYPYAIAKSSIMSHSCSTSGRVHGTSTSSAVSSPAFGCASSDMRVSSVEISSRGSARPVAAFRYVADAVVCRGASGGERCDVPSGMWTRTGSIWKGTAQYSANMVETMLTTISSLVLSVAVTSMKMFCVLPATIFESADERGAGGAWGVRTHAAN